MTKAPSSDCSSLSGDDYDQLSSTFTKLRAVISQEASLRKDLVEQFRKRKEDAHIAIQNAQRHLELVKKQETEMLEILEKECTAAHTSRDGAQNISEDHTKLSHDERKVNTSYKHGQFKDPMEIKHSLNVLSPPNENQPDLNTNEPKSPGAEDGADSWFTRTKKEPQVEQPRGPQKTKKPNVASVLMAKALSDPFNAGFNTNTQDRPESPARSTHGMLSDDHDETRPPRSPAKSTRGLPDGEHDDNKPPRSPAISMRGLDYALPPRSPARSTRGLFDEPPRSPARSVHAFEPPRSPARSARAFADEPTRSPARSTRELFGDPAKSPARSTRGLFGEHPRSPACSTYAFELPRSPTRSARGLFDEPPRSPARSMYSFEPPRSPARSTHVFADEPTRSPARSTRDLFDEPPRSPARSILGFGVPCSPPRSTRAFTYEPVGSPERSTRGFFDNPPRSRALSMRSFEPFQSPARSASTCGILDEPPKSPTLSELEMLYEPTSSPARSLHSFEQLRITESDRDHTSPRGTNSPRGRGRGGGQRGAGPHSGASRNQPHQHRDRTTNGSSAMPVTSCNADSAWPAAAGDTKDFAPEATAPGGWSLTTGTETGEDHWATAPPANHPEDTGAFSEVKQESVASTQTAPLPSHDQNPTHAPTPGAPKAQRKPGFSGRSWADIAKPTKKPPPVQNTPAPAPVEPPSTTPLRQDDVKSLGASPGQGLSAHHGSAQPSPLTSQPSGGQGQGQSPGMGHMGNTFYYNMNMSPYGYANSFYPPAFTSFPMYQAGAQTPPHGAKPGGNMNASVGLGASGNSAYSATNSGDLQDASSGFDGDNGPNGTSIYHAGNSALPGDFQKGPYTGTQNFLGAMASGGVGANRGPGNVAGVASGGVGSNTSPETAFKGYGGSAASGLGPAEQSLPTQAGRGAPGVNPGGHQQFYRNNLYSNVPQGQGYPQQQQQQQGDSYYSNYQRW